MRFTAIAALCLALLAVPTGASQERIPWDNENIHTRLHPAPTAVRQVGPFWVTELSDGSRLHRYDVTDRMAIFVWDRAYYWYCANEAPHDFFISGPNAQGVEPVASNSYEAWRICRSSDGGAELR